MFRFVVVLGILFCLVFSAAGWYVMAISLRTAARLAAIVSMELEEDIEFRFAGTTNDPIVRWEHSREFHYQGWMYDVEEIRDSAGIKIVVAHRDKRETEVVDATTKSAENESNEATTRVSELMKLFSWPHRVFKAKVSCPVMHLPYSLRDSETLYNVFLTVEIPPPKYLL